MLYVSGLLPNATEELVTGWFTPFGNIVKVSVLRDPDTNTARGFAFVQLESAEQMTAAIEALNGKIIEGCGGRAIQVEKSRRARPRTPTPGRYNGRSRSGRGGGYRGGGGDDFGGGRRGGRSYSDRPPYYGGGGRRDYGAPYPQGGSSSYDRRRGDYPPPPPRDSGDRYYRDNSNRRPYYGGSRDQGGSGYYNADDRSRPGYDRPPMRRRRSPSPNAANNSATGNYNRDRYSSEGTDRY